MKRPKPYRTRKQYKRKQKITQKFMLSGHNKSPGLRKQRLINEATNFLINLIGGNK